MSETTIKHYGVLGMKWGVRRYQNADGSLKPAGKKHVRATNEEFSKKTQRLHKKVKTLEERAETWTGEIKDKKDKTVLSEKEVESIRNSILKSAEKTKVKALKSEYADAYLREKTPAGRIVSKFLNTHNTYAEVMYNIDNSNFYAEYKK